MKKILFDLGANNGCSIRKFAKHLDDFLEFEVHAFEPGAIASSQQMRDTITKFSNVSLHQCAVSSLAKKMFFYEHTKNSSASTTWASKAKDKKRPGDCGSNIKGQVVEKELVTVDFPNFMLDKIGAVDSLFIILKMDIEGEEFRLVPALLERQLFKHVDQFYIEWHSEWNTTSVGSEDLTQHIVSQNPKIIIDKTWNALGW